VANFSIGFKISDFLDRPYFPDAGLWVNFFLRLLICISAA